MAIWSKSRFVGVRSWESPTRKHKSKPDRCFVIRYKRHGKTITETIGWASAGVTGQYASNVRGDIVHNIRAGEGYQSLKEKREQEKDRKQEETEKLEALEKENLPFHALAKKYLEWSKANKKTWGADDGAYHKHFKSEIGSTPAKNINVLTMERLKRGLQKKGLSDASVKTYLSLIGQIFNKAKAWGLYLGDNPIKATLDSNKKFFKLKVGK